jgi:hypothetical protein
MKIRAGYTISYDCPQPTPMILQVSVHPTRQPDLITWDGLQINPHSRAGRPPDALDRLHGAG